MFVSLIFNCFCRVLSNLVLRPSKGNLFNSLITFTGWKIFCAVYFSLPLLQYKMTILHIWRILLCLFSASICLIQQKHLTFACRSCFPDLILFAFLCDLSGSHTSGSYTSSTAPRTDTTPSYQSQIKHVDYFKYFTCQTPIYTFSYNDYEL